jgi:hypothetical protein
VGKRITLSTSTATPAYSATTVSGCIATGGFLTESYIPSFVDDEDPIYGEIICNVDFSGSSRSFRTVALTGQGEAVTYPSPQTFTAYAYLLLDSELTQGASQTLRVYYQIQFPDTGYGIPAWVQQEIAKQLFGQYGNNYGFYGFHYCHTSGVNKTTVAYDTMLVTNLALSDSAFSLQIDPGVTTPEATATRTITTVSSHYKWKVVITFRRRNLFTLGAILNYLSYGRGEDNKRIYSHQESRYIKYTDEPFQKGQWHNSLSTGPFFDSLSFGGSGGTIALTGTWTQKLPELYRITIGTGGALGTATYKFSVKKHTGFWQNTYDSRAISVPWKHFYSQPKSDIHGWDETDSDIQLWSEADVKVVQYDGTGVTLLSLWDGSYTTWDADSTPSLGATNIVQVAAKPSTNKIYVACRDTGIWIINVTGGSVAHPVSQPCYGIDLGQGTNVWAILGGTANQIANEATTWTTSYFITYAGLTDGNWNKVRYLKCDRTHADDRLAIVVETTTNTAKIVWWDRANATAYTGLESTTLYPSPSCLGNCPDNNDFWAAGVLSSLTLIAHRLTYGSATTTSLGMTCVGSNYPLITFYKTGLVGQSAIKNSSGTTQFNLTSLDPSLNSVAHLAAIGGGVFLVGKENQSAYLHQLLEGYNNGWTDYGWNGSAWEIGNANYRTTHGTAQTLLNGLTITFTEGSTPSLSFIATEYYIQSLNYGLLKDNSTDFSLTYGVYSKALVKETSESHTIPASSPYTVTLSVAGDATFVTLEVDTPQIHSFTINGTAVTTYHTDGSTPLAGELTLAANGTITCAAADAGKTLVGTYWWVAD